ncbi:MAG: hypothetical protein AAB075_04895 [Gemmatimonadota bacterium]
MAPPGRRELAFALAERAATPAEYHGLGKWAPVWMRLIVVKDGAALRRRGGRPVPEWGVGFAFPGVNTVVIRADALDPGGALRHEMAHLALHAHIRGRVPLWLDEGYAVVAANESGRMLTLQLNLVVATRGVGDLGQLDRALRASEVEAQSGYALAGSAVSHLMRLQPTGSLDRLFDRLAAGVPFEAALLEVSGYDLAQFERSWRADIRRRYGVFVWLAAGGWVALVAALVVVAGIYRRRRDAPRREALNIGWPMPEPEEVPQLDQRQPDK